MISPSSVRRTSVGSLLCSILVVCFALLSPSETDAGSALRVYYENIPGDSVADLMADSSFPSSPAMAEPVVELLSRVERGGKNWGSWIRAYLEAPQTGEYIFMLASDNASEFWLSTTHEPFQVRKIVENTNLCARLDFRAKSEPIPLVQGNKYYFELYHKQGVGLDHVSVGWRLPDGTVEAPIPSVRFMPVPVNDKYQAQEKGPVILRDYFGRPASTMIDTTAEEGGTVVLAPSIEGSQPITFQWYRNNEWIQGANLCSLVLSNVQLTHSGEKYRVIASNHLGTATAEASITVVRDKTPPTVLSALTLGASNTIAAFFSEAIDPATARIPGNYELNHGAIVQGVRLASESIVLLTVGSLQEGKSYSLKVKNVKDAAGRNVVLQQKPLTVDQGMNLWLRFDSKKDDLVTDCSGNYNDAVLMNGASLKRDGVHGACVEFDGADDHAVLPSGFSNFTNGMSVALWAKPMANGNWARFIDFGNGPARDTILFAREQRSNNLAFECYKHSLAKVIASDVLENGKWQHLAATINGKGEVSLYKNGRLTKQGLTNIPVVKDRTSNLIGRSNWDGDAYYKGSMDDLRIYERVLSSVEIKALADGVK